MSLFGALMGDLFDDEFSPFRAHSHAMQEMNRMMTGMFADPFGGMMEGYGFPRLMDGGAVDRRRERSNAMYPFGGFGFPNLGRMFNNMQVISNAAPSCHSYSSSSVMTMTTDETGRPQVYHATSSVQTAPGGVHETRKTVSDSKSGVRKMAVGHHIDDRAHIVEQERNYHTGDQEERQEYINLEEDESETFNQEWQQRTQQYRQAQNALSYGTHRQRQHQHQHQHHHQQQYHTTVEGQESPNNSRSRQPLAITAGPSRGEEERRGGDTKKLAGKKLKRLKGLKK